MKIAPYPSAQLTADMRLVLTSILFRIHAVLMRFMREQKRPFETRVETPLTDPYPRKDDKGGVSFESVRLDRNPEAEHARKDEI